MIPVRPTVVEVDVAAITHNVEQLRALAGTSEFCAVVKANGYGHGAVAVAQAAQRGGATWLAVALVEEAVELRQAGVGGPILLLSEPPQGSEDLVVAHAIVPTVYSAGCIARLSAAASGGVDGNRGPACEVHLKVDTGMHRVGAQPAEILAMAASIVAQSSLRLGGVCTHLAVADDPTDPYTQAQLRTLDESVSALRNAGIRPGIVHAANSAATLAHPSARLDMVRCGIAIYGQDPDAGLAAASYEVQLRPALEFISAVSHVKVVAAGERISYGLQHRFSENSWVATVPVGYADGVPRRLSSVGGSVLIGGYRRPMVGRVTMDQLMVDCGPVGTDPPPVVAGQPVVLLGTQGSESVTAWEWANRLDTIAYEITCGISQRVPRVHREGRS